MNINPINSVGEFPSHIENSRSLIYSISTLKTEVNLFINCALTNDSESGCINNEPMHGQ
jgi:hypothetical protein